MPIAGSRVKSALNSVDFLCPVATSEVHVTTEVGDFNLAVPSMKTDLALAWHVDVHIQTVIEVDVHEIVMKAHVDFDGVASLLFFDLHSTGSKVVIAAHHRRLDGFLV